MFLALLSWPSCPFLAYLVHSIPLTDYSIFFFISEEPEPKTGPDAERDPGSEPEGEASDPELE